MWRYAFSVVLVICVSGISVPVGTVGFSLFFAIRWASRMRTLCVRCRGCICAVVYSFSLSLFFLRLGQCGRIFSRGCVRYQCPLVLRVRTLLGGGISVPRVSL